MAYNSHTLSEMQSLLVSRWESVPFWTTTEATNAINEALLMWNALTGFWKRRESITTQANYKEYPLPDTMVFGTRVEFNNRPLTPSSMNEMDNGRPGWQAQTTASGGSVPTSPQVWIPVGCDLISIWPADATGGNTLSVDGISATPRLVNPGDYIDIGDEQLNAILGYALHAAALKEGGERFLATMDYFKGFLHEAAEENAQLMKSNMFRHFIGTDQRRAQLPTRGGKSPYDRLTGDGA